MKHLYLAAASVLLVSYGGSAGADPQPTPVVKHTHATHAVSPRPTSKPTPAATASANPSKAGPILHQVDQVIKNQFFKIKGDEKNGKLTSEQATALLGQLKTINNQKMGFVKSDGILEITAEQARQLNALLEKNSSAIGEAEVSK